MDPYSMLHTAVVKIMKNIKKGRSFKAELYESQFSNKLLLNAVLVNVFKWERVVDKLIEKSNILIKENDIDRDLLCVLITEMMFSKFGLKGHTKYTSIVKRYKSEFLQLMKDHDMKRLVKSIPIKAWKARYFRINTLLISLKDMLKRLSELHFNILKTPETYEEFLNLIKSDKLKNNSLVQDFHIKELLIFHSKVKFYKLEEYNNGFLIAQDKASCLAAHLLNPEPESNVLDMCAAPGMKTSHLAAKMKNTGKLYAIDRSYERFNTMVKLLPKFGVKNVKSLHMDSLKFNYCEDIKYILVDPPCSGSGTFSRFQNNLYDPVQNFQIRLNKLANVHTHLLNHALKTYSNIKRLVFSTCSSNVEENEAVVDKVIKLNENFKLLDCSKIIKGWTNKGHPGYNCSEMCLNGIPSFDCTNLFFIAVFVRRDSEEMELENNIVQVEKNEPNDKETVVEKIFVKTEENTHEIKTNSKLLAVSKLNKDQKRPAHIFKFKFNNAKKIKTEEET